MRKQRSLSLVLINIRRTCWRKTGTHSRALQMHKMLTYMEQELLDTLTVYMHNRSTKTILKIQNV